MGCGAPRGCTGGTVKLSGAPGNGEGRLSAAAEVDDGRTSKNDNPPNRLFF